MKYYLDLNDEAEMNTYITNVDVVESTAAPRRAKHHYSVTYANGETENNVAYSAANAKIIDDKLLKQAEDGIAARAKLVTEKKKGMISRIGAGVACVVSGGGLLATTLQTYSTDSAPFIVGSFVAGALAVGGIILSSKGMKKKQEYDAVLQEIDDNEFRLDHTDEARQYLTTSPNAYLALNGESEDEKVERADIIFNAMIRGEDPFSFLSVEAEDGITNEEIASLLTRSEREKTLGLTYTDGHSYQDVSNRRR